MTHDEQRARRSGALTVAIGTLVVGLPLIVAVVALAGRRWYPVLDLAMTEFRLRDVGGRHTPLIGLPGRIGTFPDQGSHPGPISFWVLAPPYRLFGSSAWAMEVATGLVQLGWIAVALWIGRRRAGTAGVVMVAAVIAVLLRGLGLSVLTQPWNPYLPLIAWLVVLLATWAVLCGDHMMLVPLVVAASFTAQTHIPYLTMAGGLGVFAVAVVGYRRWEAVDRDAFRIPLVATVGLFVVLWVGPLVDQVRRDPGNVRRLLDHFGSPTEPAIGLRRGVTVLLRHFDVVHGYGRLLTGTQRFLQVGYEPDGPIWPGVLMLVVWVGSVVVAVRLRHQALMALHATIGVTLVLSALSMARIFGKIWYYLTLWAWVTTTLMIVAVVWTAVVWLTSTSVGDRLPPSVRATGARRIGVVAGSVVAAILTLSMLIVAPGTDHPEERLGETIGAVIAPTVEAIEAGVGDADGPEGRYVVRWTDAYFFGSQGYGLVSELERAGLDAGVYEPWRVPVTPQRVIPIEQTTAEVILATGGFVDQWRADDRVVEVATFDPRTADQVVEFEAERTALIDDLVATGLDELVAIVDTNLFGVSLDERLSPIAQRATVRMLYLDQQTAIFIGPAGVTP